MKINILISACLAGKLTRYDGKANKIDNDFFKKISVKYNIFSFCPEIAGGLGIPRSPCEIVKGLDTDNIYKRYIIKDKNNNDISDFFIKGALLSLEYAKKRNIKFAILKEGSPSCGVSYIYDGSFSGRKIKGKGVTAYLFEKNGILCFNEKDCEKIESLLQV
ncbi:MAG: DUF523 domain-containing protein [Deltaproteobacteria bacterium]|nr:DUF523 domain-containing protein [Deltaproteobacteria bacterium]